MTNQRYRAMTFEIIVLILVLMITGCSDATNQEIEQAQKMADEFLEEEPADSSDAVESGDEAVSSDTEVNGDTQPEEELVVEPEIFSVAETFNNVSFESMDAILNLIFLEPLPELRSEIFLTEEQAGDNIFGDSSITPLGEDPASDLILSGNFTIEIPTDTGFPILDFVVPCGMHSAWGVDPSVWVSCAGQGDISEISTWHVILGATQEPIPQFDDTRHRTVAVVLDSDNAPENNFVPTFDNDFFQGTDLWYVWTSTPQQGWLPMVTGENFQPVPSEARMLFFGNSFALFIPGIEVPAPDFGYRIALDSHLGMWNPDNTFGNVSGSDPQASLTINEGGKTLTLYTDSLEEHYWLEGSYQRCPSWGGCSDKLEYHLYQEKKEKIKCECTGCTLDPNCECYMFSHYSMFGREFEDPDKKIIWSLEGNPGEIVEVMNNTLYNCFCLKVLE